MRTLATALRRSDSELFFGLVAPVGTPLDFFANLLKNAIVRRDYRCEIIKVSDSAKALELISPWSPEGADRHTRSIFRINRCNELREKLGSDALALFTAARVNGLRSKGEPRTLPKHAFIFRQLKHTEEVFALRQIYSEGFYLIGLYCPENLREEDLVVNGAMTDDQAKDLIKRDAEEPFEWGQKVTDTFEQSDVFMEVGRENTRREQVEQQIDRFLKLLFREEIITPTKDECGIFFAHASSLRSGGLSRQVGAAILSPNGELLAVGANEVPCWPGGQYWGDELDARGESRDARDHKLLKRDSSDQMIEMVVEEIIERLGLLGQSWTQEQLEAEKARVNRALDNTRVMNLTEFGRSVHGEMEAIAAAARVGVSVRGATLYVTTLPCHVCAKHIVAAGIKRVVYIEPYKKSLAFELHPDSIAAAKWVEDLKQVAFEPFVGVAPRRYGDLFSIRSPAGERERRKDKTGRLKQGPLGLRMALSPYSYIDREAFAANMITERVPSPAQPSERVKEDER